MAQRQRNGLIIRGSQVRILLGPPHLPRRSARCSKQGHFGETITLRRQVRSPFLLTAIAIGLFAAALWYARSSSARESLAQAKAFSRVGCGPAYGFFGQHRSGAWVTVSGKISGILGDSYGRFRHQRFTLGCSNGLTILIVNDISVGQRAPVAARGRVTVRGQYVWDSQGGLVHFTHHADNGPGGWILYANHVYQ